MSSLAAALEEVVDVTNPWDDQRFADDFAQIADLDSVADRNARLKAINRELGRTNAASIDAAHGLFAVLDGVDVDSGTASEIGYAAARGKFVCGLRTDFRLAGDNEGSIVNLQVQYFIEASGGTIVRTSDAFVDLARRWAADEPMSS